MNLRGFVFLGTLAIAVAAHSVDISHASRLSLHPTEPTEIEFTGSDLRTADGTAAKIWCSQPALIEPVDPAGKDRGRVRYRITPKRTFVGVIALRGFDHESVTRAFFFATTRAAIVPLTNHEDKAIDLPAVLEGGTQNLGEHRILVDLKKGERFCAEVLGSRLGTGVDAMLELTGPDGREVAFSDDHPVTGSDPFLELVPEMGGQYVLSVRDVEYRGSLRLQLRLNQPVVSSTCFPPAIGLGETRRLVFHRIGDHSPPEPRVLQSVEPVSGFCFAPATEFLASAFQTSLPIYVEPSEPVLAIPSVYCGTLSEGNEHDELRFVASSGDQISINLQDLGGPITPHLRLFYHDNQVAEHHWGRDRRGMLRHTITETGEYRLTVTDALQRTGPELQYCLTVRNDQCDATLKIAETKRRKKQRHDRPHRFSIGASNELPLLVRIDRRGLDGPVTLYAECDGTPCRVEGKLESGKNDAEITIHLPQADQSGPVHIDLYGACRDNDRLQRIGMDLSEHMQRDYQSWRHIPSAVSSPLVVLRTTDSAEPKEAAK